MRKGLVVFQFGLSTLIIVSTAAIYLQIRYIQHKDLGLVRENVITFPGEHNRPWREFHAYQAELLKQPGVVFACSQNPLLVDNSTADAKWTGKDPDDRTLITIMGVEFGFVETMKMRLVAGRSTTSTAPLIRGRWIPSPTISRTGFGLGF